MAHQTKDGFWSALRGRIPAAAGNGMWRLKDYPREIIVAVGADFEEHKQTNGGKGRFYVTRGRECEEITLEDLLEHWEPLRDCERCGCPEHRHAPRGWCMDCGFEGIGHKCSFYKEKAKVQP